MKIFKDALPALNFIFFVLIIKLSANICLANGPVIDIIPVSKCELGSYRSTKGPWNACPGFKDCDIGHYCQDGSKFPCKEGFFGDSLKMTHEECSGSCSAGYYCPKGSSSKEQINCGGSNYYCPSQSAKPVLVSDGYYSIGSNDNSTRTGQEICPIGHYCKKGILYQCPGGSYGSKMGLSTPSCSGLCEEGFYCPAGSVSSRAFECKGPEYYCPAGSSKKMSVAKSHHSIDISANGGFTFTTECRPGYYCEGGQAFKCPSGRYGDSSYLWNSSCSGICAQGYYCPPGSVTANQFVCGNNTVFCPTGSGSPTPVSEGYYTFGFGSTDTHPDLDFVETRYGQSICPVGEYCTEGRRFKCPSGRYGDIEGQSSASCSGLCAAGYWCGQGSTTPYANQCASATISIVTDGNGTEVLHYTSEPSAWFCPEGSRSPNPVYEGYYTIGGTNESTRTAETKCTPGTWCDKGLQNLCPAGRFGDAFQLYNESCTGLCKEGYYCPEGSAISTDTRCGDASKYCPKGSSYPSKVPEGYYSTGDEVSRTYDDDNHDYTIAYDIEIAPPGFYASRGILYGCPAGTYGNTYGLSSSFCSGQCSKGFYCPPQSTSPKQKECGAPDLICPKGSPYPIPIEEGFYTTAINVDSCPPGKFRNTTENSTVIITDNCELCPEGTYKFVEGDDISLCIPCETYTSHSSDDRRTCICDRLAGGISTDLDNLYFNLSTSTCQNVSKYFIPSDDDIGYSIYTKYEAHECERGHYCIKGIRYPCAPGRYGSKKRETNNLCSGVCYSGYYCPEASISATEVPCGESSVYCPEGSSEPKDIKAGFYTEEERRGEIRTYQKICPLGYYCPGDGNKYICEAGLYGSVQGLNTSSCSGVCKAGYLCPAGSVREDQLECGGPDRYCVRGSHEPKIVDPGFYTIHTGAYSGILQAKDPGNKTCSAQVLCEPGYYCDGGIKYQCPEGTYGYTYGLQSVDQCKVCAEGYYCPSYPGPPQTQADPYKCGGNEFYCFAGTGNDRKLVEPGYYTSGGDELTRTQQNLCPLGHYCKQGSLYPCPAGVYGNSRGLTDKSCSGWCPAGYYCPAGSPNPTECEDGSYSLQGSSSCITCPGGVDPSTKWQRCRDSRRCCAY